MFSLKGSKPSAAENKINIIKEFKLKVGESKISPTFV
jgi:hypothetical protein